MFFLWSFFRIPILLYMSKCCYAWEIRVFFFFSFFLSRFQSFLSSQVMFPFAFFTIFSSVIFSLQYFIWIPRLRWNVSVCFRLSFSPLPSLLTRNVPLCTYFPLFFFVFYCFFSFSSIWTDNLLFFVCLAYEFLFSPLSRHSPPHESFPFASVFVLSLHFFYCLDLLIFLHIWHLNWYMCFFSCCCFLSFPLSPSLTFSKKKTFPLLHLFSFSFLRLYHFFLYRSFPFHHLSSRFVYLFISSSLFHSP